MFCLYEQVIVIAHKAVVVDGDTVGFGVTTEQLQEIFIIFIITKNYPLLYASVDDVVVAGDFDAGFSWHNYSLFLLCLEV